MKRRSFLKGLSAGIAGFFVPTVVARTESKAKLFRGEFSRIWGTMA